MSPRAGAVRSRERVLEVARGHDVRVSAPQRHREERRGRDRHCLPALPDRARSRGGAERRRARAAQRGPPTRPPPTRTQTAPCAAFSSVALDLQLEDGGLEAVLTDLARTEPHVHSECAAARGQGVRGVRRSAHPSAALGRRARRHHTGTAPASGLRRRARGAARCADRP